MLSRSTGLAVIFVLWALLLVVAAPAADAARTPVEAFSQQTATAVQPDATNTGEAESTTSEVVVLGNLDGIGLFSELQAQTNEVTSLAFREDGKLFATGHADGTIRLWAGFGNLDATLRGHSGAVSQIAFAPDRPMLASGGADSTVLVWNLNTRVVQATIRGPGKVSGLTWSPDGFAMGFDDHTVGLWDPLSGTKTVSFHSSHPPLALAYSARRGLVSVSGDGLESWRAGGEHRETPFAGFGPVKVAAVSPDGTTVATAGSSGTVQLWDVATGTQRLELGRSHDDDITSLVFTDNGRGLAGGSNDGWLTLWNLVTYDRLEFRAHLGAIRHVAMNSISTVVISSGDDGVVRLWGAALSTAQPTSVPQPPIIITVPVLITATPNLVAPTATRLLPTDVPATPLHANCIGHTVMAGDTPFSIAVLYGIRASDLMAANGLTEETFRFVQIGDVLIVPLPGCSPLAVDMPPTATGAVVTVRQVTSPGDLSAEGVEIENTGDTVDISGWTLSDDDGNSFTFPQQLLFSNARVTVYTRTGQNTPIAFYWGRDTAIWQSSDVVTLRDKNGAVQSSFSVP